MVISASAGLDAAVSGSARAFVSSSSIFEKFSVSPAAAPASSAFFCSATASSSRCSASSISASFFDSGVNTAVFPASGCSCAFCAAAAACALALASACLRMASCTLAASSLICSASTPVACISAASSSESVLCWLSSSASGSRSGAVSVCEALPPSSASFSSSAGSCRFSAPFFSRLITLSRSSIFFMDLSALPSAFFIRSAASLLP